MIHSPAMEERPLTELLAEHRAAMAAAIREERTRHGLTQRELAAAAGITKSYVSHIEIGFRNPSPDTVEAIQDALGRSRDARIEVQGRAEEDARKARRRRK